MKPADVCLAVLVAVIWGFGFVASRLALDELSPALMTTLRFAIAAVPCLFVRRPNVSWRLLVAISGTLFLGQFLAQSWAIAQGVPVGLASVIVQSQALFTVAFAALAFGEIPTRLQMAGIGVAAIGLLMICGTVGFDFSVGAFAVLMISPVSLCDRQSVTAAGEWGADVRSVRVALPGAAAAAVGAGAGHRRTAGDLAFAGADVADRPDQHALRRGDLDLRRLLAVGPAAARLHGSTGGAVRAAGAVHRCGVVERHVRRDGSDRCGSPAWSPWSAASPSCCCRSGRKLCPSKIFPESPERTMSHSLLIAFVLFAAVMFFTPGPNNIMVLSSGLTYGFRRTLPHIAGITIGFAFMVGAVGFGFGTIFVAYPVLQTILKYAGAAYLIYLAAVIAMAEPVTPGQDNRRGPMTFTGAAMFQWVNVKGWVMVIGTITAYAGIASFPWNIGIQVLLSLLLGTVSTSTWALSGSSLRSLMTSPRVVRAFNIVMAALLLASLYPVFMDA